MPSFSKSSLDKLSTCHPQLQRLMQEVVREIDITILCGFRGEKEQNEAFANHTSMLRWPHGKHNKNPSLAVDVAKYPVRWDHEEDFIEVSKVVRRVANNLGIDIEWGGAWKFKDLPHYQLKGE